MLEHMSAGSLRLALIANAAFSVVTGVALVVFAGPLAAGLLTTGSVWPGVPAPIVAMALGLGLLGFAAVVALVGIHRPPPAAAVRAIIVADAGWVVTSAVALALLAEAMTASGRWTVGVVAIVVAVLALAQWRGLQTSGPRAAPERATGNH